MTEKYNKISIRAKQRMFFFTHKGDKGGKISNPIPTSLFTGWVEKKLTNNHNRYYFA